MNNRNYRSKPKRIIKNQLKRQLCLFIMTVVILFISCAYFGNILSSAQDRNNNLNNDCYQSITIQYGDTLWSIAEKYMTNEYSSVQEYIKQLKKINSLTSDNLEAGKYLIVTCEQSFESSNANP